MNTAAYTLEDYVGLAEVIAFKERCEREGLVMDASILGGKSRGFRE